MFRHEPNSYGLGSMASQLPSGRQSGSWPPAWEKIYSDGEHRLSLVADNDDIGQQRLAR
jgi:hypothetical protein